MTPKQKQVLTYMRMFKKKNGYPPGMLVTAIALGETKGSIRQVFSALQKKGLLVKRKKVQEGMYDPVDNVVVK